MTITLIARSNLLNLKCTNNANLCMLKHTRFLIHVVGVNGLPYSRLIQHTPIKPQMNHRSNKEMSDIMNSKISFIMKKSIVKRVINNSIMLDIHDIIRPCKLAGKLICCTVILILNMILASYTTPLMSSIIDRRWHEKLLRMLHDFTIFV